MKFTLNFEITAHAIYLLVPVIMVAIRLLFG